jgi:hypothetical protein
VLISQLSCCVSYLCRTYTVLASMGVKARDIDHEPCHQAIWIFASEHAGVWRGVPSSLPHSNGMVNGSLSLGIPFRYDVPGEGCHAREDIVPSGDIRLEQDPYPKLTVSVIFSKG